MTVISIGNCYNQTILLLFICCELINGKDWKSTLGCNGILNKMSESVNKNFAIFFLYTPYGAYFIGLNIG